MQRPAVSSLSALLDRLSGHLDALASDVHHIEHAICDELGKNVGHDSQNIKMLQRLDFLRQSLEDIALLNLLLSRNHDGLVDPDLASKLRIEATQEIVRGDCAPVSQPLSTIVVGDVDLF